MYVLYVLSGMYEPGINYVSASYIRTSILDVLYVLLFGIHDSAPRARQCVLPGTSLHVQVYEYIYT